MKRTRLFFGFCAVFAIGILTRPTQSLADCAALTGTYEDGLNVVSATRVENAPRLPDYCRITGDLDQSIRFEMRFPLSAWNGKFMMVGCGGFCGDVDPDRWRAFNSMNPYLARGYAVARTDTGHVGESVVNADFARDNRSAQIDWAHVAIHRVTEAGKSLINQLYARAPAHSYFSGCSNGGRQALMAASRYPTDYDGIISGSPVVNVPDLFGTAMAWNAQVNEAAFGNKDIAKIVGDAVIAQCDAANDGLADGILADPTACRLDLSALLCVDNGRKNCLSEAQVAQVSKWYNGPMNSNGNALYPGVLPGAEPFWNIWLIDRPGYPSVSRQIADTYIRNFMPSGGAATVDAFDFDQDPQRLAADAKLFDPDPRALEAFRAAGGKLLIYHGWSDALVPGQRTVQFYKTAEEAIAPANIADSVRLFMIPGFDHCGNMAGNGGDSDSFDFATALETWVEDKTPPISILETKRQDDGTTLWKRPVCAYPSIARFNGIGDPDVAASYTCEKPDSGSPNN